jgi:hypothetical protein
MRKKNGERGKIPEKSENKCMQMTEMLQHLGDALREEKILSGRGKEINSTPPYQSPRPE